ncbi:MAG: tyrosine-type recombinase/integrase [Oscillospiraceae bacterium]|nr:tyrosine-type recombinase/integrase [Oscillospiraceae bacterium]
MEVNISAIRNATESVLRQLREQNYKETSIANYRRFYDRLYDFMSQNSIEFYTEEVGQRFFDSIDVGESTYSFYAVAVRRINDFINGEPYRCHHQVADVEIPAAFTEAVNAFLTECERSGNKSVTIKQKKKSCGLFLQEIEKLGCTDLSCLNVQLVSQALLIFENKDHYAVCRQFLGFLSETGIIDKDYSGIVPRYRRRKTLPTTYTVEEITAVETSIDTDTPIGKRNLAIILLATRVGLRSGDIAKLRYSELDFESGSLNIIQEKTCNPLSLQMPEKVIDSIKSYIECTSQDRNDDYVFHSMSAPYGRITTSIIRHITHNAFKDAGIDITGKKHGPHVFRSSLASSMVNDGVSYEMVRRILGHSDPDVIKHYAKSDIENLRLCAIEPPAPEGHFQEYLSGRRRFRHV